MSLQEFKQTSDHKRADDILLYRLFYFHLHNTLTLPPTPPPLQICTTVPLDASIAQIEAAVLQEYGSHLHTAMRGPTGNSRYFRQLTKTLIPLLLPEQVLHSRYMYVHCNFT